MMLPFLVLLLRILAAAALFGFLGWALYTLWRDLRFQSQMVTTRKIPAISLSLVNEPGDTRKTFTTGDVVIGRDGSCDFVISDETISARHARLTYRYLQWWVEDLQSTNGTYLNDEKVETATIIINGDEIRMGQIPVLVEVQSMEA
jgi:pSer/pThr/pTyr-binding forkhead associated (FHA) protein